MFDAVIIITEIIVFTISFHYKVYDLLNSLVLVIFLQDIVHFIKYSRIFYVQSILVDSVMDTKMN